MSVKIVFEGVERAQHLFGLTEREALKAAVSAVNATAAEVRKEMLNETQQATGINMRALQQRSRIRRASTRRAYAEVLASAEGIPVKEYRYRALSTAIPTRAKIMVDFIGGQKMAAGFINPRSQYKLPLRSKNHSGQLRAPEPAWGFSLASAFSRLRKQDGRMDRIQARLAVIFEDKMKKIWSQ
jgi:hypothetical protein